MPKIKVNIVNDIATLDNLVKKLEFTKEIVALDTETNSLNPLDAELVGIGFCLGEDINLSLIHI